MSDFFGFNEKIEQSQAKQMNAVILAFVGDAVYSLYVREKLALTTDAKGNDLNAMATNVVRASSQAEFISERLGILTEDELSVYKRGRNAKKGAKSKSASVSQYNASTGLEAVLGYLYVTGNYERLSYILNFKKEEINED